MVDIRPTNYLGTEVGNSGTSWGSEKVLVRSTRFCSEVSAHYTTTQKGETSFGGSGRSGRHAPIGFFQGISTTWERELVALPIPSFFYMPPPLYVLRTGEQERCCWASCGSVPVQIHTITEYYSVPGAVRGEHVFHALKSLFLPADCLGRGGGQNGRW